MKVVYIHFHLKTGGVTTVLWQQVNAVRKDVETLVIAGTAPETVFQADTIVIKGLGYDEWPGSRADPQAVADSILAAIHRKWAGGCDLVHIHNATLAKNRNFLAVLRRLQDRGLRLFIQIHDFAEDGRPGVYSGDEYPCDCHYGVINSRDHRFLLRAGLKPEGLHQLFNMVQPLETPEGPTTPEKLVLYPVRALRRKNIGEALLLALFFTPGEALAVTLPPSSPQDVRSHEGWKAFARAQNLPVRFDVGSSADFKTLVAASTRMLTTSVMEGFGFSFLEPWAAGKFLQGRKLPEICRDFEIKGIQLDHLYSRLQVPLQWIDAEALMERRWACLMANSRRFHYGIDPDRALRGIQGSVADGAVDFGILDEQFQKQILSRLISSPPDKACLLRLNPRLAAFAGESVAPGVVEHNRNAILRHYNETVYRKMLLRIYNRVLRTPVKHRIDKHALLAFFFNPSLFSLLTWGDYAE